MKRKFKFLPFVFAITLTFAIYACSSKFEPFGITPEYVHCHPSITKFNVLLPCTVVYRAEKTGNVDVTNLTYRNDSGLQTINYPVMPYVDTLVLNVHDTVSMSVGSIATGGSIEIKVHAWSGGTTYEFNQSCGN